MNNTPFPATNVDTNVDLDFYSNTDAPFNGWNLIGNPYTCNAYLLDENNEIIPFYRMNETGDAIVAAQPGTPIKPCEGVFVVCPNDGMSHHAVFTTTAPATVGEAQDDPEMLIPVHHLLGDQPAHATTTSVTQTISLSAGVNWFSTNVEITMDDLKAALEAAATGNITITSQRNGMTTYNGTRWRGTLSTLDVAQSYRITVAADCEITLEGMPVDPADHPITINSGANWIGFPLQENMSIADVFAGFAVNGDVINSQREGMATYNGTRWRGTLGNGSLKPGQGYIYKSSATGTRVLVFPNGGE